MTAMWEWVQNRPPILEEAFPTGTMVVGVDATYPPFAVDNGESLYGIDIDIANELAHRMNIDVRFVPMGFDGLYDSLIDGQIDVLISALLFNSARTRDVLYTRPYFDNGLQLVTDADTGRWTMIDLPNQSIALEYGSIAHGQANTWLQRIDPFTIHPYELPQYALDALRLDSSDSALVDMTTLLLYQSQYPEFEVVREQVSSAPYVIAIRHDREATHEWIDAVLENMKNDGTVDAIINQWFDLQESTDA
ncbi:MAG: ABC transporter substrate-binding protein [Chloroflexota bacterium]